MIPHKDNDDGSMKNRPAVTLCGIDGGLISMHHCGWRLDVEWSFGMPISCRRSFWP